MPLQGNLWVFCSSQGGALRRSVAKLCPGLLCFCPIRGESRTNSLIIDREKGSRGEGFARIVIRWCRRCAPRPPSTFCKAFSWKRFCPDLNPTCLDGTAEHAEFLIFDSFPWSLVEHIGVFNQNKAELAKAAIKSCSHQPTVQVENGWHF